MNNEKIINFDFEGWPIEKMNIRDILIALGAELKTNRGHDYWEIPESSKLDAFPITLEDDGMGYGVNGEFISSVYVGEEKNGSYYCNVFREKELDYANVWLECGYQPGSVVDINGKDCMLYSIEETDGGYVVVVKEWLYSDNDGEIDVKLGESKSYSVEFIKSLKKI